MGRFERGMAKQRTTLVEGHTASMTCATDCSCRPDPAPLDLDELADMDGLNGTRSVFREWPDDLPVRPDVIVRDW